MKYRKKPVIVEAFKYEGDLVCGDADYYIPWWAGKALEDGVIVFDSYNSNTPPCELFINTLEGRMHVSIGDFIIRGVNGEIYPCKSDIFYKTYEIADSEVIKC